MAKQNDGRGRLERIAEYQGEKAGQTGLVPGLLKRPMLHDNSMYDRLSRLNLPIPPFFNNLSPHDSMDVRLFHYSESSQRAFPQHEGHA